MTYTDEKPTEPVYDEQHPLNMLSEQIHRTAVEHGWWENERAVSEIIANIHDEVSEAWQCWVLGMDQHT